jgi:hypothetical protein
MSLLVLFVCVSNPPMLKFLLIFSSKTKCSKSDYIPYAHLSNPVGFKVEFQCLEVLLRNGNFDLVSVRRQLRKTMP